MNGEKEAVVLGNSRTCPSDQELYEIDVAEWVAETPKAWHVKTTVGTHHWLAKSQIVELGKDFILIPMWLAQKSKLAKHIEEAS